MSTLGLKDSVPAIAFREYNKKELLCMQTYDSDANALTQRVINKRYEKKHDEDLTRSLFLPETNALYV